MPAKRRPPKSAPYHHAEPVVRDLLEMTENLKQSQFDDAVGSNSYMAQLRYGGIKDPCISRVAAIAKVMGLKLALVPDK